MTNTVITESMRTTIYRKGESQLQLARLRLRKGIELTYHSVGLWYLVTDDALCLNGLERFG